VTDLAALEVQSAIYDAAHFGDTERLAALLRGNRPLSSEDRAYLADYVEGKLRRPRGRPAGAGAWQFKPTKVAADFAERYLRVWRRRYGIRNRIEEAGGRARLALDEACRKACERVERLSAGRYSADPSSVRDLLRRPRTRRQ
jgi:hypothetical protein